LRLAVVALFGAGLAYEWARWPNGSALLGPLGIIWYNGADGESVGLTVLLLPAVLAFPLKPCCFTGILSALAFYVWLILGALALGIGC
jgi:hypothetical protein